MMAAGVLSFAMVHVASAQRLAKPVIDTVNHHIVRVMNSGPTAWTGTSGWRFVLERTMAPDSSMTAIFAQPAGLAVDSHGNVFETDWKVDGIQEFNSSGKFIRQIGRKGDGPGEFHAPIDIVMRGDTIRAYAGNQSRVSLWRTDGTLLREWRVDFCCGSYVQVETNAALLIRVPVKFGGTTRDAAIRWRSDGTILDTVWLPRQPEAREWRTPRGGAFPIPFGTYQVGTFNSRGWYVSGNSSHYTLTIGHGGADTARIIGLPGTRAPVSNAYVDSVFARYAKLLSGIAKRGDIPSEQPYFTELHADEHDNIWIERPGPRGTPASFDVITPDGVLLGSVSIPAPELRLFRFANDRLYAVGENDDGEPIIRVYRIDRRGK